MQHQPHEPFFSFTVPPKPTHNILPQYPSPASTQHNLLSSVVPDPSHLQLSSRSPSYASPTLNRPNTAGRFAFNVPSATPSATPSGITQLSPNQLSTADSSVPNSLDRPYSSSGLPASTPFPQTVSNSQAFASNHAPSPHDVLKSATRSSFPSLDSQSPLLATLHAPRYAIPNQQPRPMTAPGSGCMGRPDLGDDSEFNPAHAGLFNRMHSYPPPPTELSGSEISQTATSQAEPNNGNHLVQSSPCSSSVLTGFNDAIGRTPHRSSSGSSDPDSRIYASNSTEYNLDDSIHSNLPHRSVSGSGRPSICTRSSESAPESPESLDGDHPHPQSYIHTMSANHFHHLLRPSTHSGTTASFGEDKFLAQPLQPRPATGYLHHYESPSAYSPIHSQSHHYPPRLPAYPPHSSHVCATSPGHYAHVPGSTEPKSHDRLYNFNILPGAPRKRARRRFDEVERLYCCNYPGCTKAYGTLNHLNAHISMQKHGPKRLPQEFKEIRKEWRAKKKAESEARAAMKQTSPIVGTPHDYNALGNQDALRGPHPGFSTYSSPGCVSACGGVTHTPSPAIGGSYSAPAHSQQFAMIDRHNDWHNDYRANPATIDEQPEYVGSSSSHASPGSLLPNQSIVSSTSPGSTSYGDHHYTPQHQVILGPHLHADHRPNHLHLNHHSRTIVDHSSQLSS